MLYEVDLLAIIVSTIAAFLLGWVWYMPNVFGKVCAEAMGMNIETYKNKKHPPHVYILSLVYWFIAAFAFSAYVGTTATLSSSVSFGLVVGICWVGTSLGIGNAFSGHSLKILAVNAGYYIAQFVLFGVICAII